MPELPDKDFEIEMKKLEEMEAKFKNGDITMVEYRNYVIETKRRLLKNVHEIDFRMAHDLVVS